MGEMVRCRGAIIVIEYEGKRKKLSAQIAVCWAQRLSVFWMYIMRILNFGCVWGTFWRTEVCPSVFYLLYWPILKVSLDFLHPSALVPVYKGPSIVFSLHPVFFFFFLKSFCMANKEGIVHFDTLSSLSSLVCPVFLLGHKLVWKKGVFWRQGKRRKEKYTLTFEKGNWKKISISKSEKSEAIRRSWRDLCIHPLIFSRKCRAILFLNSILTPHSNFNHENHNMSSKCQFLWTSGR